jgi:acetylornithine deacetylase/succinyl-diaminopimelate desuccinylase-like protein
MRARLTTSVLMASFVAGIVGAVAQTPQQRAFRELYRELIEIDTTDATGDTLKAAEAMAARLRATGFPADDIRVVSTGPRKGNLVARLRGTGARKPMLLLAHIDVVPPGDGWQHDPFKLTETEDGYFHGRGVIDDKAMAAIFLANLIELHRDGFRPERDIVLALTTDEELAHSPHNGVRWILDNERA